MIILGLPAYNGNSAHIGGLLEDETEGAEKGAKTNPGDKSGRKERVETEKQRQRQRSTQEVLSFQ